MTVNSYLSNLASELVLSPSENDSIFTSISTIKARLDSYFDNIAEKKVFGSYVRHTILPRAVDEKSDIDIMIVFENPYGYKPQTFLNHLKQFAEFYYSRSEIYQSSPTIVLELHHIKFELTPAYAYYGTYYIPGSPSEWMCTNPDGFYEELTKCNVNNAYKIKPIVRLLKHWNIRKNYRDIASFQLEERIAYDLKFAYVSCISYTDYLKRALEAIKNQTDYSRVKAAISHINAALAYEENGFLYIALEEIKKVFPEV